MLNPSPISGSNCRWLAAIVFAALLIRLLAAYLQPNYIDEGYNYYLCKAGIKTVIEEMKTDVHTPVTQIAVYPLTLITSDIFYLRLPSVFCSTLTVCLSFFLFRHFAEEHCALLLTLFTAVSYTLWNNDVLMRPYGPLTMFLVLVWLGMLGIYKQGVPYCTEIGRHPRLCWTIFFIACLGAGSYHLLGCLALSVCVCCAAAMRSCGTSAKRLAAGCIAAGILPSMLWFVWGPLKHKIESPATLIKTNIISDIIGIPTYLLNAASLKVLCNYTDALWALLLTPCLPKIMTAVSAAILALYMLGAYKLLRENLWTGCWLLVSFWGPVGVLLLGGKLGLIDFFQVRYAVPLLLPFVICLYSGCPSYCKKTLCCVLIAIGTAACLLFPNHSQLWNQYWQSAVDFIDQRQRPSDVICVNLAYTTYSFCMAYNCENISFIFQPETKAVFSRQNSTPGKLLVYPLMPRSCSEDLLKAFGEKRIFLVLCESELENDAVFSWLLQHYKICDSTEFKSENSWADVRVYLLERQHS